MLLDPLLQDPSRGLGDLQQRGVRARRDRRERVGPAPPERLGLRDVADPGADALVEQRLAERPVDKPDAAQELVTVEVAE